MNAIILALDESLNRLGYVVARVSESRGKHKLEIIEYHHISNKPMFTTDEYALKLYHIERKMECLRDVYEPTIIVREGMATRSFEDTKKLGAVHGIVDIVFRGYEQHEYSPTEVKKVATGDGKSDKAQVETGVLEILRDKFGIKDVIPRVDDESDALGVLITHLTRLGIV
jgi:Holliday junction resolvasome RuvABC endonuclease subunit